MTASRIALCAALATAAALGTTVAPAVAGNGTTGNGAPSGAHYQFNIIGVEKGKTADMTADNGRRMFVGLGRDGAPANTKIMLSEGDFNVGDANGTDGEASFTLPNPDPDADGTTDYSVYVRALGKPGGKATMQSCYEDSTGTWCAVDYDDGVEPVTVERTKSGAPKFVNVSKDLLYVDACTEWDTTTGVCAEVDQVPLFGDVNGPDDPDEEDTAFFWDYDNQGLRVAQLRFYEVSTTTPWAD
jgi:hypothetical protein